MTRGHRDLTLLTVVLDHSWKWYDAEVNRACQAINLFLVASAVLFTGYTAAESGTKREPPPPICPALLTFGNAAAGLRERGLRRDLTPARYLW